MAKLRMLRVSQTIVANRRIGMSPLEKCFFERYLWLPSPFKPSSEHDRLVARLWEIFVYVLVQIHSVV